jgi:hypothetical protein
MIYFAIYLNDRFIGFITEESQKVFLLETNLNYKFYPFTWEQDFPPMSDDILLVDEKIQLIK